MTGVDFPVNLAAANKAFENKCSACGNFSSIEVLLQGMPDAVREAVISCAQAGSERTFMRGPHYRFSDGRQAVRLDGV